MNACTITTKARRQTQLPGVPSKFLRFEPGADSLAQTKTHYA
jgi:hypothetical protein